MRPEFYPVDYGLQLPEGALPPWSAACWSKCGMCQYSAVKRRKMLRLRGGKEVFLTSVLRHLTGGRRDARETLSGTDASSWRSEERRVGKECRSRWSPY